MLRVLRFVAALGAAACVCSPVWAARGELVPETVLNRHGLTRPWFVQVELDQGQSQLEHVILYDGVLYAQTNTAMIHAIDAETGRTLWSKRIGRADRPTMTPDADRDRLAVCNGLQLYVLNRFTGEPIYQTRLQDAPGAGPALSAEHVYVPMVSGMVVAYPLKTVANTSLEARAKNAQTPEEKAKIEAERLLQGPTFDQHAAPLMCRSYGRVMIQPIVTRDKHGVEYTVWPTDRGYVNMGRIDRQTADNALVVRFRLDTGSKVLGQPGYLPPDPKVTGDSGIVFVASRNGLISAIAEEDGATLWRFTTGESIFRSPAVIDERLYVPTEYGGMYCLDGKEGKSLWQASGVRQFVAASKDRVYGLDRLGRLVLLDAASGACLGTITSEGLSTNMANTDTDRLYLVNDSGLIQCLRETELTSPILHGKERKAANAAEESQPKKAESASTKEATTRKEHKPAATPKEKPAPKEKPKTAPKEKAAPKEKPAPRARRGAQKSVAGQPDRHPEFDGPN